MKKISKIFIIIDSNNDKINYQATLNQLNLKLLNILEQKI